MNRRALTILSFTFVLALLLVGCGTSQPEESVSLLDVLPGADAIAGWSPMGEAMVFDEETIFDLVNGQADYFFVYGFEQVAVQSYRNAENAAIRVEVWQLAEPTDAYGLFTAGIVGEPIDIGNEGDTDPGWRITFWQDRYTVQVRARQETNDADLRTLAQAVAAALPAGGERPALTGRLPSDNLLPRSVIFFHEGVSIQNDAWLGDGNLLALGPDTDGVLAQYEIGNDLVQLLLVQYPTPEAALAALDTLEREQIEGFVSADVHDNLLAVILGNVDKTAVDELLVQALASQ